MGVRYYTGLVGRGEYVMPRRQPENQSTTNAVQVRRHWRHNLRRILSLTLIRLSIPAHQVGHMPRAVAGKLAPLMDISLVNVEGRMIGQNVDGVQRYKLALDMMIYGRPSLRSVLDPELVWATPDQRGFEHMRAMEAAGHSRQPPSKGKKDPRFKGKGQMLGGVSGFGGIGGSGAGLSGTTGGHEELRSVLEGFKNVRG